MWLELSAWDENLIVWNLCEVKKSWYQDVCNRFIHGEAYFSDMASDHQSRKATHQLSDFYNK